MKRILLPVFAAALLAAPPAGAQSSFTAFALLAPDNSGTNSGVALNVADGAGTVTINLWWETGTTPQGAQPCLDGLGDEVCAWNIRLSATGGISFVPGSFTTTEAVVSTLTATEFRANGGESGNGQTGPNPIGSLDAVITSAPGTIELIGTAFVPSGLTLVLLAEAAPIPLVQVQIGADFDGDGIPDADDSCPTVVNTGSDSETDPQLAFGCTGLGTPYSFCTGPGTASPGDGVDAACDTCPNLQNPVIASPTGAPNRTRVSGQLDDDGDGVGNRCDFDYDQQGLFISPVDFAQAVKTAADAFPSVGNSNCGLNVDPIFAMLPCGVFDHDSLGLFPSPFDFSLDAGIQGGGGFVPNGPSCGAACTPAFGGAIGSGTEILGKAICDGPRC